MSKPAGNNVKLSIIAAVLVGLLAIVAIHKYISVRTEKTEEPQTVILIAEQQIEKDAPFTEDVFSFTEIPPNAVSNIHVVLPAKDSAAFAQAFAEAKTKFIGKKSSRVIAAMTPIFWMDAEETQKTMVEDFIPERTRAITLPVDTVSSVANFIRPGSHIDIVLTASAETLGLLSLGEKQQDGNEIVTMPIMQNLRVIAVGKDFTLGTDTGTYNNITLNVTPEEALLLIQARTMGTLTFMLRNLNDKQINTDLKNSVIQAGAEFQKKLMEADAERRKQDQ